MTTDSDRRIAELKTRMERDHEQRKAKDAEANKIREAAEAATAARRRLWLENVIPMIATVAEWLRKNLGEAGAKIEEQRVPHEPNARTIKVVSPTHPGSTFVTFQLGSKGATANVLRKTAVSEKNSKISLPEVAEITEESIRDIMLKVLE